MHWIILIVAGLFEVVWALSLKHTAGFTRLWPTVMASGSMVASVILLGVAMKELPVGVAYAIWVGIGVIGTVLVSALMGEGMDLAKAVFLCLIAIGVAGLKWSASA